ncbi:thioredoxin fold domain-containing protein, partial [Sulfurovum sp.]|uniref:thioredoxin fold domain-containing protein n=1 Tax=Sulfurovum sp. TaxID=1969726 RepID=UPI00286823BE
KTNMSKTLLILLTSIALMATLNATETITDKTKLQELKSKNRVLQDPVLYVTGAIEKPNSYILKVEARTPNGSQLVAAILDKQTSELYIGSAYDKNGQPITFPKDVKAIQEGVSFSYGTGSKDLYIVTDPECPYCSRFEKSVAGKLSDYRVHVILMPLSFHKKAPAMIEWIMQGKDDVEKKKKFEELMLKGSTEYQALIKDAKKPFVYSDAVGQAMKKVNRATMELNVRGTPAVYDANFNPVSQEQLLNTQGRKK